MPGLLLTFKNNANVHVAYDWGRVMSQNCMPTKSPFTIPVKQIIRIQLRFTRKAEEMMKDSLKL